MKFSLFSGKNILGDSTLTILPLFETKELLSELGKNIDNQLSGFLLKNLELEKIKGGSSDSFELRTQFENNIIRMAFKGCGDPSKLSLKKIRQVGGEYANMANAHKSETVRIEIPYHETKDFSYALALQTFLEGVYLANYQFNKYRDLKDAKPNTLKTVEIITASISKSEANDIFQKVSIIGESIYLARDLINEPAIQLTPSEFAKQAQKIAKETKILCKVLGEDECKKLNMGLFLGVSKGSKEEAKLIHLTYKPAKQSKKNKKVITLLGKGLTFDSGGLSLKPADAMMDMKIDMSGGAAVLAAMRSIALLQPDVEVHGVIVAVENMPDGNAIRPGDILISRKGVSVEVLNTDAEGRLALADGLSYCQDFTKPNEIIDLATLTGACMVALGLKTAGLYSNNDQMAENFLKSAELAGEGYWRMPLLEDLKDAIKSKIADIKNIGNGRWGGSITAALFLERFINDNVHWTHLDIAGPASTESDYNGYIKTGAVGFGVRSLIHYVTGV